MGKRNGQARLTGPPIVALADSAQPVVLSPCHLARPGYIMRPGPPVPLSANFALVCSANGKSLRAALGGILALLGHWPAFPGLGEGLSFAVGVRGGGGGGFYGTLSLQLLGQRRAEGGGSARCAEMWRFLGLDCLRSPLEVPALDGCCSCCSLACGRRLLSECTGGTSFATGRLDLEADGGLMAFRFHLPF